MTEQVPHNITLEGIEIVVEEEEYGQRTEPQAETPSTAVTATPNPLNVAFDYGTSDNEQSQSSLSQQQSQTTRLVSSYINEMIDTIITEQGQEAVDLRSPTSTGISTFTMSQTPVRMISTGTMPQTPVKMISTGTMPRTPTGMKSTGTMPMTPLIKSIGTMPMTPTIKSTGTMPTTPTTKTTGTMPTTPATKTIGTMPKTPT